MTTTSFSRSILAVSSGSVATPEKAVISNNMDVMYLIDKLIGQINKNPVCESIRLPGREI